jgi:UDP-N-acetylglucosamine acyltransferase
MARIHPTAIIDSTAHIGQTSLVGPYCVVGAGVTLGDGCKLHNHVTITGPTTIGEGNEFYPYSSIGQRSQDLKYEAEPTSLEIGNHNTFREFVTIHRATAPGDATKIGSHGNFLAYSHVAHDCVVGDHVIFSNNGTLAGHVIVGDHAVIGGLSGVHQFCRIGAHAFLGMGALTNGDVPPFTMVGTDSLGRPRGINSEGLKRRGFDAERISAIKRAYRTLYVAGLPLAEAKVQLTEQARDSDDVKAMLDFIEHAERPLLR